jgi:hypothetical protein
VLDTTDARRSAEFWRQLLDLEYPPGREPPGDGPADWLILRSREHRRTLAFQRVDELRRATWPSGEVPQQLHLDLAVASEDDFHAFVAHAKALGASELFDRRDDAHEPLVVLGDPMGHPFCVFVTSDLGG